MTSIVETMDAPQEHVLTSVLELGKDPQTKNEARPASAPAQHQDISTILRIATDKVLEFLSTASNETLGACIVGLSATTYLILGRVGLVLIGAVGGITLHATWEKNSGDDANAEQARRREVGLDVARRVLDWRQRRLDVEAKSSVGDDESVVTSKASASDFSDFPAETAKALNTLTDAVIRDYVNWWYSPILPLEEKFPRVSRSTFSGFLHSIASHMASKRPSDSFLEFSTNSSSILIVFLNELSSAFHASPNATPEQAIETYLDSRPDSNLANIASEDQQQTKLMVIADDILEQNLDAKVYICPPARVFLREVLANQVLGMTLSRCSQDEWINEWIVYLLEDGEPELIDAINAGVDGPAVQMAADASNRATRSSTDLSDPIDVTSAHKRTQSRAQEAMEDAMREAERMNAMIAEEEARMNKGQASSITSATDDASDSTNTQGIPTPGSSQDGVNVDSAESAAAADIPAPSTFTSFDQLAPQRVPTALMEDEGVFQVKRQEILTLHKAHISIFDNGIPGDKRALKSKPGDEYMIQIEPASSSFPGWMIPRKYADFEPLHEVLRRISTISGAVTFAEAHAHLPSWKGRTSSQLSEDLERYLMDATQFEQLAESEGMKRFLEKERGVTSKSPKGNAGFWAGPVAFENVGKGVFDVLSKAPKGVAGGGKAVIGGVTSVFGNAVGMPTKSSTSSAPTSRQSATVSEVNRSPVSNSTRRSTTSTNNDTRRSIEISRASTSDVTSVRSSSPSSTLGRSQSSLTADSTQQSSISNGEAPTADPETQQTPHINLPPPPSDMPDDYAYATKNLPPIPGQPPQQGTIVPLRPNPQSTPLTTKETTVSIELLFAVINELYTLSSAWSLRRTLLNAAKSYLLRPANPQLESIRQFIQESVLDTHTSDAGIAAQIYKMRENALPTEEELAGWPKPRSSEERERLRENARRLLVAKGMPAALTGVMGMAASGEALGRVFDALQIQKVAKGLMFGLMLQALRTAVQ